MTNKTNSFWFVPLLICGFCISFGFCTSSIFDLFVGENMVLGSPTEDTTPTPQLIRKAGYNAETHLVLTEDGYILTLHRIPSSSKKAPAVLLQHGLLGSSADWILAGKEKGLAYILSDKGYDVWLGNARGNTYSRNHTTYSTTDSRFWHFSWHEMGVYDLPAVISYISNIKGDGILYAGHSMGTTMFYVMAIERQDIATKVKAMFSLAPVAFVNHLKSPIRLIAPFVHEFQYVTHFFGINEFLPRSDLLKFLAKYGCDIDVYEEKICSNALFVLAGFDNTQFNYTLMPTILGHTPAGGSTMTVVHYAQEILSGKFRRFDFGTRENLKMYNSTHPPEYDLSRIQVPILAIYADNDWLASPIDVHRFFDQIPVKLGIFRVAYPKFNHVDFLWALDAPKLVYSKILPFMDKYKNSNKNLQY